MIAVVAAAVSVVVIAVARRLAPALGLVDVPDAALKTHDRPVPAVGGLGVWAGVLVAVVPSGVVDPRALLGVSALLLLGLVDDRRDLSPKVRLAAEVGAGALVAWGVVAGRDIGAVWAVVAVGAVVVGVNAVNLLDGIDGLAGSAAAVGAVGLALLSAEAGRSPLLAVALAGATVGFVGFNWHPARVFLGDSGAYAVGGFLAFVVVDVATAGGSPSEAAGLLVVAGATFGVFLLDLVVTVLRRRRSGRPLFRGDRSHVYDQLVARGASVPAVVLGLTAVHGSIVATAVVAARWWSPVPAGIVTGGVLLGWLAVAVAAGFVRPAPDE